MSACGFGQQNQEQGGSILSNQLASSASAASAPRMVKGQRMLLEGLDEAHAAAPLRLEDKSIFGDDL